MMFLIYKPFIKYYLNKKMRTKGVKQSVTIEKEIYENRKNKNRKSK